VTKCHIPEDLNLQQHCCKNLNSHNLVVTQLGKYTYLPLLWNPIIYHSAHYNPSLVTILRLIHHSVHRTCHWSLSWAWFISVHRTRHWSLSWAWFITVFTITRLWSHLEYDPSVFRKPATGHYPERDSSQCSDNQLLVTLLSVIHNSVHYNPPLVTILSVMNPVYTLTPYNKFSWHLHLRFTSSSYSNSACTSHLYHLKSHNLIKFSEA
jgi:hypothetical protein